MFDSSDVKSVSQILTHTRLEGEEKFIKDSSTRSIMPHTLVAFFYSAVIKEKCMRPSASSTFLLVQQNKKRRKQTHRVPLR